MKGTYKCAVRGFTLLEVLITIVVLAVGLLGASVLISRSTKSNLLAYEFSTANLLLNWMEENMRANPNGAEGYKDVITSSICQKQDQQGQQGQQGQQDLITRLGQLDEDKSTANSAGEIGCAGNDEAKDAVYNWKQLVNDTLANKMGLKSVSATLTECDTDCKDKAPNGTGYVMTIKWASTMEKQEATPKQYQVTRQVLL